MTSFEVRNVCRFIFLVRLKPTESEYRISSLFDLIVISSLVKWATFLFTDFKFSAQLISTMVVTAILIFQVLVLLLVLLVHTLHLSSHSKHCG